MRNPLEQRIASLRGQARRQLALYGASWVVAGLVLAITLAGLFDWLFHLSRELRLLLLLAVTALTGWLIWRYVIVPLVVRFRDLDIALRIEQRWPGLHDRLATTVQFLQMRGKADETEAVRGSTALRDETIRRTLDEISAIDFREVIDPRPARRALASAAVPAALAALMLLMAPGACRLALARLFNPFGKTEWPKQTHLAILEPTGDRIRIARGDGFKLEVGVAPGELLPGEGTVTYRYDNGEVVTRRLGVRDADGRLTDRLPEVERSFRFTVAAGDDVTEQRAVEVVPPPSLSHARVVLTPPAYTGELASIVEPLAGTAVAGSEFDVDGVLEGTVLEIQAITSKAVVESRLVALGTAPWLRAADASVASDANSSATKPEDVIAPPAVTIKPGGSQLVSRFTVEGTGAFGFELVDPDGFRSQPREMIRFNVTSLADSAPQVSFEDPVANRDVTPNAVMPIAIRAEDDFGIGKVWLEYRVGAPGSGATEQAPLVLYAPDNATPAKPPRDHLATYRWELKSTELDLSPGTVITIQAVATDLDALHGPKAGKSREIQLRIVDPDTAAKQLDEARSEIRDGIARALEMERQAIRPVDEAKRILDRTQRLDPENRDALNNAETVQRQVSVRVADPAEGLEQKIAKYLEDQANLRIDNPGARDQMKALLEQARSIRDNHLGPAEESLTRANKGLENAASQNGRDDPSDERRPADAAEEKSAPASDSAQSKGAESKSTSSDSPSSKGSESKGVESKSTSSESPSSKGSESKGSDSKSSPSNSPSSKGTESKGSESKSSSSESPSSKGSESKGAESKSSSSESPSSKGSESKGADSKSSPSNSPSSKGASSKSTPNEGAQQGDSGQQPDQGQANEPQPAAEDGAQPDAPSDELARAAEEQKAIADELQRMLDNLSEFETYRGMVDEAKNLLNEQRETMKAADEAAEKLRLEGKPPGELTPEQAAQLENLGQRQSQVGDAVRQLENKMNELSQRLDAQDPLSASALREASQQSRERNTGDKASDAAKQLSQNQMGKAREQQRGVEQDLKKLLDSLQNRRENELARLVKELKNAERDLENLRQQQSQNRQRTQQAGQIQDEQQRREELQRLAKEQQELEKELRRQLQRLQKLRADSAARAGSRAAQRMSKASQQQEQGEQEDADEAGKEQEEALADLEEAQEELEETRREAEEQLAMEQLTRVRDDLANLHKRQNEMVEETSLYAKKLDIAPLTLAQKKSVVGLGRAQETIRDETSDLIERLDAAPVYALVVKRAAEAMEKASEQLRKGDPGPDALAAQRLAARRFDQLLEALKPDEDGMAAGQQQQGGQQGGGGGGGGGGGDGIPGIAQLKLLKMLQIELNERTESLDDIRARKNQLDATQESELAGLHEEQRNVADMARDLSKPRRDDGEE